MKLLIVTQAIDQNHPVLGFFVRWVVEFSKHFEHIHVIALSVGEYEFPKNVTVHSLGKELPAESYKLKALFRFFSIIWKERNSYDAVFVHMNPEYVVLAGWWWRLTGKKVGLWYTHKSVDLKLRMAEFFANTVFTASKESFRLSSKKLHVMGHGIDTDFFTPDPSVVRGGHMLSVGRLMKTKRHDLAIRVAAEANAPLRIAGEGSERERLKTLARELNADVSFLGALTQAKLRNEYRAARSLVHTSETGSLDKVVLEAFACGCPVQTNDPALKFLEKESAKYVRANHSLPRLISAIVGKLQ